MTNDDRHLSECKNAERPLEIRDIRELIIFTDLFRGHVTSEQNSNHKIPVLL